MIIRKRDNYLLKIFLLIGFCVLKVCLKSKMLLNCLSSSVLHHFSGNNGESGAKKCFKTSGQLIQWFICFYKRKFFLVYSFSEQVAAKENSPETAWYM